MEKAELLNGLRAIAGDEKVITDEAAVLDAAKDYIGFRRYERDSGHNKVPKAACVVMADSTEKVSSILKFLNDNKTDVVPRTGGSSVTRGVEPQEGGVILDGSEMNALISIDEENMTVTAGCGMPLERLEKLLNEKGYTAGHFPQSLPMADLGGLVATRSTGQFSTLYGGIEDLLVGLEAVLADGTVIRIKNVPRRSAGPDLRALFLGSEGMLGFITEVTMKLFKYQPENRWMKAYAIDSMQEGFNIIKEVMHEGYRPAVVRLHDPVEVQYLLKFDVPKGKAILLFLCEGPKNVAMANGEGIAEIASKHNVTDLGSKAVEQWLVTRNNVCDDMDKPIYYNMGAVADTCEISAGWSEIGNVYAAVIKRLHEEIPTMAICGGHSSHSYMQGTNIYFQFAFMEKNGYEHAEEDYMHVIRIIMEETLERGGSIAHHHGSGKYRTRWMPQEHGSSYTLMYKLKEALDPNKILNKGVILVEEQN